MLLPKMNVIYCPKGKAGEYAKLAFNHYKGCTHKCSYCFGPGALHKKQEKYYASPDPKDDIIAKLQKDAEKLSGCQDVPEILISFVGDPYQHDEIELGLTRETLKILIAHNLPFTVLTKGGSRARRDFDLLSKYPKARFGTSLVFNSQSDADVWEPCAASIEDRISTIKVAHEMGIRTWVSVEPVIYPDQALQIIREIHPIVDHWKVGKVNHNKAVEQSVDWIKFREEVTELLESIGADFYLKKSLTELKS